MTWLEVQRTFLLDRHELHNNFPNKCQVAAFSAEVALSWATELGVTYAALTNYAQFMKAASGNAGFRPKPTFTFGGLNFSQTKAGPRISRPGIFGCVDSCYANWVPFAKWLTNPSFAKGETSRRCRHHHSAYANCSRTAAHEPVVCPLRTPFRSPQGRSAEGLG